MKKVLRWGCFSFLAFIVFITVGAYLAEILIGPTETTKENAKTEAIKENMEGVTINQPKTEKKVEKPKAKAVVKKETSLPKNPKIDLEVSYENNQLTFNIETNIPLPVEVMIGIEPKNSLPTDLAYGFSGRVKIDKSPIQFIRDAKDTYGLKPTDLKNDTYEADVVFYPFWGAENGNPLAAEIKEKISGTYTVNIGSSKSEGSIKSAIDQSKKQAWGMDIAIKDKWIEKKFVKNLGVYQELKTKGRNPKIVKTYYFPEADMTFFVSEPLKQVLMWKFGKVDRL